MSKKDTKLKTLLKPLDPRTCIHIKYNNLCLYTGTYRNLSIYGLISNLESFKISYFKVNHYYIKDRWLYIIVGKRSKNV